MPISDFDAEGNLPVGVYQSTIEEVIAHFSTATPERRKVSTSLQRIYEIAQTTGHLQRLLIFGSYITAKPAPNDVDVILIVHDDFKIALADAETKLLLDHQQAGDTFGASLFWIRPGMLLEPMEQFIVGWQTRHDGGRRGIVEVIP